MESATVHIKVDNGLNIGIADALRIIADGIGDGRISCTGLEMHTGEEDGTYFVKAMGACELVLYAPLEEDFPVFDMANRNAVMLELRRRNA